MFSLRDWTATLSRRTNAAMDLHQRYPAIADLKARAKWRVPHAVWEFLDSGTGQERTLARNRAKLDEVLFHPSILHGEFNPDLSTVFLGHRYDLPVGIAPVGMSGSIWPRAEALLAGVAAEAGQPYCLSTTAAATPEEIGPLTGGMGWFQLYPPRDEAILADTLRRAWEAGFHTLILTADVPVASRRERQIRGGISHPPKLTPRLIWQALQRPSWLLALARTGMPKMKLIESYAGEDGPSGSTGHSGYLMRTSPDWDYLKKLRDHWQGHLVVKGVLDPTPVAALEAAGVDALWVSNHAGRQFDAAISTIEALPAIRAATNLPLVFDSGVEGGLDVMRALALGADFVMLGRAFHYGLAAAGSAGAAHVFDILRQDMQANMGQIGAERLSDLPTRLTPTP